MNKKVILLLALVASVCFASCNPYMKKAQGLIEEYSMNVDSLSNELNSMTVSFTDEEWAYVEAEREFRECELVLIVGHNLDLNVAKAGYTEKEAGRLEYRAEILRVPLNDAQTAFAQKYWDMRCYSIGKALLERWVELHS